MLVASKPPRKAYLLAVSAPLGPYALLRPNSIHLALPAIIFILDALVVTKQEKFRRFRIGVSTSYSKANGPSSLKSGSLANTIVPTGIPCTFNDLVDMFSSHVKNSGSIYPSSFFK